MGSIKRRTYTPEERAAVLEDVRRSGIAAAWRKHGIPQSCVSKWASAAGVKRSVDAAPSDVATPPVEVAPLPRTPDRVVESSKAAASTPPPPRRSRPRRTTTPRPIAAPPAPAKPTVRVAKIYTPSQIAAVLDDLPTLGVTAAAKKHKVSRFSIYDWKRKVTKAAAGKGPSPTSGPAPQEIEQQRDREILEEWKKHPGLGPSQIVHQLARRNIRTSVHTARRVMEDAGYRPPKVVREKHDRRYEAVRPNQLWHLDFVQRWIGRCSTFTLILIDDCSRYVVGHGVDDAERADMVIDAFHEATRKHGRPERIMHDKGSAFWSWRGISRFVALLTEMGIDQIVAEAKEWNGKVEVFNANLHKELFDAHRFADVAEMRRRLDAHVHWYNHGRTHHALGGLLVPADRYYGRAEEVLARIEAGAGREVGDGVELRERCLELFKVISRGGVPEIWLLGQKLLGAATTT